MNISININSSNLHNLKIGQLRAKYNTAGDRILRYYVDFRHTILDLHKEVSAPEIDILQNKVDTLMAAWDKKFDAYKTRSTLTAEKELAEDQMVEAEEKRNRLRNILNHTLNVDDAVDWDILKDRSSFKKDEFKDIRPEYARPSVQAARPKQKKNYVF